MPTDRRIIACASCVSLSRRQFVSAASASLVTASFLDRPLLASNKTVISGLAPKGPAASCRPILKVCFVRREGDYGMRWPGQIYDGESALRKYIQQITKTAGELGLQLDLLNVPIHSNEEADAWVNEATTNKPDGLLVVLLDRQEHAWPTANKAIDTGIPTVIFSPIGSSFTTNTVEPSKKPCCFICSTDDFRQVQYGMKMLHAGTKMRATRCLVIKGTERSDTEVPDLGIQLRNIPASMFIEEYERAPVSKEIVDMSHSLIQASSGLKGATEQDVINGVKSCVVARTLLEREESDAITMDCLGALGKSKVSLPCIAWSVMNDAGIPAACEADIGAVASHIIVQYLFDRPGFQQDPVAETAREAIIGAHCSCPTKLQGFDGPSEPYDIVNHHGVRDATPRPVWKIGQRVTSVDVLTAAGEKPTQMIISAGEVIDNVAVPPAGGCVVSAMVKFDGVTDVLGYPGFHQVFFYGDFKRELTQFCRLFGIEPLVV